jgi:hypothetical protein
MAERTAGALRALAAVDPVALSLRLTLLTLLLRPVGGPELRPWILVLVVLAFVSPGAVRKPLLWLALAALCSLRVAVDWPLPDNHAYLLAYWCLAAGIALWSNQPERALAWSGRLLIGAAFFFASLWKLFLSPDFLSGDFMRFTWILDARFADAAALLGRMDAEALDANRAYLVGAPDAPLALVEPVAFLWVTRFFTWWAAGIEAAVAIAFLWPGALLARWRDALLLLFCATTYAVAPVFGFAWLLLSMGAAQCPARPTRLRATYLAIFALMLLYRDLPWMAWLG